ncbi:hypothetical protein BBJ29_007586 [Phytophthora kernoviae]|uniref:Leishmanolysin-like peptidase n=1 Tax=Phytophthora kernoviae TaxID=325452 RepID=A0A3F2RR95_9STRA|nr:hypothetical protein BBJ29_007586 [Phytophthora kernoviae]RLN62703.1 hypothetical protein BBP00_00004592 [Phytophthora kernoviae]
MKTGLKKTCSVIAILLALPVIESCIHDSLDHKVSGSFQQYGDNHPFMENNRNRKLAAEDSTNFQQYEQTTANAYEPIRITPYYDNSTLDLLSAEKRALIFQIIPDAINRFKNALQVVPVQGKLAAQHTCKAQWMTTPRVCQTFVADEKCLDMVIPDEHFGATRLCSTCPNTGCASGKCTYSASNGVADTDFLLYVRSATTDYCGTRTLAYASSCQKDQYDRPTFGMANFCPSQLSTAASDYESQVATAMHEMTHALGFSAQFFPLMRYADGTPRTKRDAQGNPPTYTSGTCPNGQAIDYFVQPSNNTVQYFTERGHSVAKMVTPKVAAFVKSHFNCSSLVGAEIEQQDDSGCIGSHWEERIFEPEYMTPVNSFRNVFSALTLAFFEDSGWYRAPTKGGDDFADYCPINTGYSYGDCSNPSNLAYPGKTTINILGESYCPNCKCTYTTLRSADSTNWVVNARRQTGCYAMSCIDNSDSNAIIEFTIPRSKTNDAVKVNCTSKGQQLTVPGFSGFFTCPDPFVICNGQTYNFGGDNTTTSTSGSGTGSGTANMRSTNAASSLGSETTWIMRLLQLGLLAAVAAMR